MRTQVGIVGAGPSGLMLSQLLHVHGIESVVLEKHSASHVLERIRAGVLEEGLVQLMREAGAGDRLDNEGLLHAGIGIVFNDELRRIDLQMLTGKVMTIYGQTELTRDLMELRTQSGGQLFYEVDNIRIHELESTQPKISFEFAGNKQEVRCDWIVGCDGYYGPTRQYIPKDVLRTFERVYPFGWLGLLADTAPACDEVTYVTSPRGFALCSLRSPTRSRYYVQCSLEEKPEAWPDDRFWRELQARLPANIADNMETGSSLEKSIAPLRSFVAEPMRYQRLLLAGDAAHIVPPTGAKGLNLAASDIYYCSRALVDFYHEKSESGLACYSDDCLRRVWRAERFSWWLTGLLHLFPNEDPFETRMRATELEHLLESKAAQQLLAENYTGLPY